jgi:hypothetical protein
MFGRLVPPIFTDVKPITADCRERETSHGRVVMGEKTERLDIL